LVSTDDRPSGELIAERLGRTATCPNLYDPGAHVYNQQAPLCRVSPGPNSAIEMHGVQGFVSHCERLLNWTDHDTIPFSKPTGLLVPLAVA
jgi:hypothetical protein